VLDGAGRAISTIAGPKIQGPWDSTVVGRGSTSTLFVSMVLKGGAAAGRHTVDNSSVVPIRLSSGPGRAPKVLGERVIANRIPRRDDPNAGDGNLVEVDPAGRQVAERTVDTATGAGSLFGLVAAPSGKRLYFVDDGDNTLKLLH
jgi:hypothetical protein